MSNTMRKRLLPVALVMALAAIGVVALTIALASPAQEIQAHGSSPGSCDTDAQRAFHDLISPNDPCPTPMPTPEPTMAPGGGSGSTGGGEPVSYVIEGPDFVLQDRQNTTRYTINVLDEDGNPADFSQRAGSENVMVFLDVVNTAQGDVDDAQPCLPSASNAIVRDNMNAQLDPAGCEFAMDVSAPDPWFEIVASTIVHGTDVGITLEVDGKPVGDTHTVTFLNPAQPTDIRVLSLCIEFDRDMPTMGMIEVEVMPSNTDEDLVTGIANHYMVVRGPDGNLATTAGSVSTRTGALTYERMFSSSDLTTGAEDPDDNGLLLATFSGATNDTTYNVRIFTLNEDGSIDEDSIMTGYVHVTK